jgi:phosphocarrier protein HPr
MIERAVTVVNELGLHARAAARFVHLASRFDSQVRVGRNGRVMDGKSILGILLLAAARGMTITISAHGADENEAVEALAQLVESGFGEASAPPATANGTDSSPGPGTSTCSRPGDTWNGSQE